MSAPMTSGYGNREHPVYGGTKMHHGVDVGLKQGTPIGANVPGTVVYAGMGTPGSGYNGYGYTVAVRDPNGNVHLYGHLSKINVSKGQRIYPGQLIALSGGAKGTKGAGTSTGAHLHYEVRRNGKLGDSINPKPYI